MKKAKPVYCDYIAHLIATELKVLDQERLFSSVGHVQYDLGLEGELQSTIKTIFVEDRFGTRYRIIIQEA
jgi:hypothetical protein